MIALFIIAGWILCGVAAFFLWPKISDDRQDLGLLSIMLFCGPMMLLIVAFESINWNRELWIGKSKPKPSSPTTQTFSYAAEDVYIARIKALEEENTQLKRILGS